MNNSFSPVSHTGPLTLTQNSQIFYVLNEAATCAQGEIGEVLTDFMFDVYIPASLIITSDVNVKSKSIPYGNGKSLQTNWASTLKAPTGSVIKLCLPYL